MRSTEFEPGELRAAAVQLLEEGSLSGATVTATWANFDGSGLGAEVFNGNTARSPHPAPTDAVYAGYPVDIDEDINVAAVGRQDDNLHIGGSRLVRARTGGQCSLGFAVNVLGGGSGASYNGGMFASHCGDVGDTWLRPSASGTYFSMGSTAVELDNRDGAILRDTYFQPAIYIGDWESQAYVGITTVNNPVVNTEICYSGSFSGTTCGNLVSVGVYNYSLAGVGNITGVRTANPQGLPAAGNGDSGGPGIVVVQHQDGTLRISASVIISAIPANNKSANCQGVPGSGSPNSTDPAHRQCSHIVTATKAREVASGLGYEIRTVAP